jgi:hypothetical protein
MTSCKEHSGTGLFSSRSSGSFSIGDTAHLLLQRELSGIESRRPMLMPGVAKVIMRLSAKHTRSRICASSGLQVLRAGHSGQACTFIFYWICQSSLCCCSGSLNHLQSAVEYECYQGTALSAENDRLRCLILALLNQFALKCWRA